MVKLAKDIREIVLGGERISYIIRKSPRARYLRISMNINGGLMVTLPRFGGERLVEPFLREKSAWILKHLRRMKKFDGKTVLKISPQEYKQNKNAFLRAITGRVEFFNSLYNFQYGKISIRNQTSLWGSCTRAGNLQFNFKLSYLPQPSIDYVVVHELCHLKEHNHGKRFWKLVEKTIPNHKIIRRSLRQYIMNEG